MSDRSTTGIVIVLVLLLFGFLIIFPMLGMFAWGPMMMGRGMMGGWGLPAGPRWGFMFVGMLIPFLLIILLAVGAYLLLTSRGRSIEGERAHTILNERYAKGEITKEQYVEMKKHLTEK